LGIYFFLSLKLDKNIRLLYNELALYQVKL